MNLWTVACQASLSKEFLWASYFYGTLIGTKLICFSPVTLSYVNLIIRPGKESRRVEGKIFFPYNMQWIVSALRKAKEYLGIRE